MVVPTVAQAVAFTIPGVFLQGFPNAPKERDPLTTGQRNGNDRATRSLPPRAELDP